MFIFNISSITASVVKKLAQYELSLRALHITVLILLNYNFICWFEATCGLSVVIKY